MSDYLGNLIGKSFGQAAVVKPRRAPLFAPSPYLTGALAQAAVITPADDGPLLSSRRAWVATEAQPDSAARDAQEPPDRGQWLPVSTDAITAFGTADAPFTPSSGLQVAPISAGTPISPSEEPESSASGLSPAPRVRTRRRSDSAGPDQTPQQPGQGFSHDHASSQSQRQNIAPLSKAPRSNGDDFDPSAAWRKPEPSVAQSEKAQRDLANPSVAQDRSVRSSDNTRASPPDMPPVDFDDPQRRSAAPAPLQETPSLQPMAAQSRRTVHADQTARARTAQEARALGRAPAFEASASGLAEVDRRSQPVEDLPRQVAPEAYRPQRPGSITGAAANGSRLATIRTVVPIASATAQDAAAGSHTEPAQMESNLTPGETRPVSAAHHLSPARLTGALAAQLATLQSAPPQQAIPDGPPPEQAASVLRPALRSAPQEASEAPRPAAVRTSSARAGAGPDNAPAPVQQTIHVTIGRIEVRATPPPSAPARKQNAAPVMSLDEYLKTRSGGKR